MWREVFWEFVNQQNQTDVLWHCLHLRYKDALNFLRDSNFPFEEARRLGRDRVDILEELEILEQDIYYQTCAAESLQACALGNNCIHYHIVADLRKISFQIIR